MQGLAATEEAESPAPASSAKEDLVSALVHLGYSRPEAEKGVDRALKEGDAVASRTSCGGPSASSRGDRLAPS